ncbi:MAG TPA: tetratricopeptide repeat protein [Mariprofundaceae bacterium]|nr:tetratricopeptide repeat protein [Mariprofundaceae bacterium]
MNRLVCYAMMAMLMSGCATTGFNNLSLPSFSIFNNLKSVQTDFDKGRIMEARARVLSMDKKNEDYAKARAFLIRKIEPARVRLLNHYTARAKKAEANGEWYSAKQTYDQAATFSLDPSGLQKKRDAMDVNFRQARMNALLKERRIEDIELLSHQDAYEAPKGVPAKDEIFVRKRQQFQEELQTRAELAYSEAKRFLRKGYPAVAYMEIESHLRLDPQSASGKSLQDEIKAALPKGIVIPKLKAVRGTTSGERSARRVVLPKSVSVEQIQALIKKGDLISARQYATVYRREGGKGASKLLKQIQASIAVEAESKYNRGSLFYRKENLDLAIQYWSDAVALEPENVEYSESLRRAQQLKEHLELLRQSTEPEQAPAEPAKGQ